MRNLYRGLLLAALLVAGSVAAQAAPAEIRGKVVVTCGTQSYTVGSTQAIDMLTTGELCSAATLGASSIGLSGVTSGADNVSNTATGGLTYSRPSWYDGSTWDRARGDSTDGLLVNLGANNDVTVTSTTTLTPGTDATNLGKAEDAVAGSGDTGVASLWSANEAQSSKAADGDYVSPSVDTKGNIFVRGSGTAGTAATGVVTVQGIASMTPVQVSQATASNLNATVVGTGTFATQSAITAASGSIASGAVSSGAIASGAFASGAVSSGAYASGSLASGAVVDITNLSTPVTAGAATATKGTLLGCRYQSTPDTATNTQQMAVGCDTRTNQKAAIFGADSATGASVGVPGDATGGTAGLYTTSQGGAFNGSTWDRIRSGDVNNQAAVTGVQDVLPVARYNATLPTLTDTRYNALQADLRGNLKISITSSDATTGAGVGTAADGTSLAGALKTESIPLIYNGSTADLMRGAANSLNSTGTGLATSQIIAQCDDTSPTAITENSFGNVAFDCTNHSLITSQAGTGATSVTRPADTTAYAANDAMSNSTSSPTSGGFTLTGACRKSGGIGMIQSVTFLMSTAAGTSLQAEIWLFNQSVTNINDNAAFAVSDGDMANFVGKIPFTTSDGASNNASATVANVNLSYTCTGSANLRYLVKVLNAYTPASSEVLTVTPTYVFLN